MLYKKLLSTARIVEELHTKSKSLHMVSTETLERLKNISYNTSWRAMNSDCAKWDGKQAMQLKVKK